MIVCYQEQDGTAVPFKTHVSQPYVTVGLIMLQYNFIFNFLETNLLLKRNWLAWYALFPSVILFRTTANLPTTNLKRNDRNRSGASLVRGRRQGRNRWITLRWILVNSVLSTKVGQNWLMFVFHIGFYKVIFEIQVLTITVGQYQCTTCRGRVWV